MKMLGRSGVVMQREHFWLNGGGHRLSSHRGKQDGLVTSFLNLRRLYQKAEPELA